MMLTVVTARARSSAPPAAFFARWADLDTWPEWDTAVAWGRLDGPFAAGTTGELKPARGPKVRFVIETLEPGREYTDVSAMPGARLWIRHLVRTDDGGTDVEVEVSLDGPLARVWKLLLGRGLARSTVSGLDRLVVVAESDAAAQG
jgi:uncharacterized protein YndB with AHSA1/START domain